MRTKLGMSRKALATHLKVSIGAISNWENNIRRPRQEIAHQIIDLAIKNRIKVDWCDIYPRSD
jgi:DNA-binding transcriptional regulator YiaG